LISKKKKEKRKKKKKKKKNRKNLNEGVKVDVEIFQIVGNILNSLEQVFIKLHPFLEKILLMEEAKEIRENGTLRDIIQLLDKISKEYKRLSLHVVNQELTQDINDLRT